jgi:hypothetical protein
MYLGLPNNNGSNGLTSEDEKILRVWDTARRTIESLDRSLSEIRAAYFIALGVAVAGITNLIKDKIGGDLTPVAPLLIISSWLVLFLSISFLCLDEHYDRYQATASTLAQNLEEEALKIKHFRLTCGLNQCAHQSKKLHWVVDLLFYFSPGIIATISIVYFSTTYMGADQWIAFVNEVAPIIILLFFILFMAIDFNDFTDFLKKLKKP